MSMQPYTLSEPDRLALFVLVGLKESGSYGMGKPALDLFFVKEVQESFEKLACDGLLNKEKLSILGIDFYSINEKGKEVFWNQKIRSATS